MSGYDTDEVYNPMVATKLSLNGSNTDLFKKFGFRFVKLQALCTFQVWKTFWQHSQLTDLFTHRYLSLITLEKKMEASLMKLSRTQAYHIHLFMSFT
jgi:hypothetical protein